MKIFVASVLTILGSCADTFSEELKIWRFSEQLSLMSFQFNFDLETTTNDRMIDYFPAQFYELAKRVPQLTEIEANLVQGRWRDNFIPRVQGFAVDPNETNRELP
jgi:hypothetical protein